MNPSSGWDMHTATYLLHSLMEIRGAIHSGYVPTKKNAVMKKMKNEVLFLIESTLTKVDIYFFYSGEGCYAMGAQEQKRH